MVYNHLMDEFRLLEESAHQMIAKMIEKCTGIARKFYKEMDQDDANETEDDKDDGDAVD